MAQSNPRKVFNFAIDIEGINQFLIQTLEKPEVSIEAAEHGGSNYNVKTPAGVTVGDATLTKIKPAPQGDSWAWDWMQRAQNMNTGTGMLSAGYARDVVVRELDPQGITLNAWLWTGVWVKSTSDSEYQRGAQSDNIIETVVLSVNRVQKLK